MAHCEEKESSSLSLQYVVNSSNFVSIQLVYT